MFYLRKNSIGWMTFFLLSFIFYACKNPVTPTPPPPKPDSTSHEVIWEADTLGDWNSWINAVWGSSPDNVWAVGWITRGDWGTNIVHWNGNQWEDYDYFEADLNGMFGLDSNNIWAVGETLHGQIGEALIAHYDGSTWKTVHVDYENPYLMGVWASAPDDVFAVGDRGTILHYDGNAWTKMDSLTDKQLRDVWGFAHNDVYACGAMPPPGEPWEPILLHYDGQRWKKIIDTTNLDEHAIYTVWGSSADNVYFNAASWGFYHGNVVDGWIKEYIPDDHTHIRKIRGSSDYNIFQVGDYGIVLHYNGHSWHRYDELLRKPGGPILSDVVVFENSVFIVGWDFINKGIVYRGTIQN